MITANENQSWLDAHSSISLPGNDLAWLKAQRTAALAQFEKVGLPGVRDEEWRYTNLRALKSNSYQLNSGTELTVELADTTNPRLVFVDGLLNASASTGLSDQVSQLSESIEGLEASLGSTLPTQAHGFTALNTAYAQDGYVVSLKPGQVLDGILEVVFVSQSADTVSHTRNLIIAGANSQCTIVERHIGVDGTVYLNNVITEIVAGDNAHVDHYKIQQESNDARTIISH